MLEAAEEEEEEEDSDEYGVSFRTCTCAMALGPATALAAMAASTARSRAASAALKRRLTLAPRCAWGLYSQSVPRCTHLAQGIWPSHLTLKRTHASHAADTLERVGV